MRKWIGLIGIMVLTAASPTPVDLSRFSLVATPAAVRLGQDGVTVTEETAHMQVVVTNEGDAPAWVSAVSVDAGWALVMPFAPQELLPGDVLTVDVMASPAQVVPEGELLIVAEGETEVAQGCSTSVERRSDILSVPLTSSSVFLCDEDADGARAVACGGEDCDDANPDVYPRAFDACDGVDTDCDGIVDDDERPTAWYPDADGDGAGRQQATAVFSCIPLEGMVSSHDDCVDEDAQVQDCACAIDGPEFLSTGQGEFDDGDAVVTGIVGNATVLADVDGDGCSELFVGGQGVVYVFAGPVFGEVSAADAVSVITAEQPSFGNVMTTGDLTGDGVDDVVVAAPDQSTVWAFTGELAGSVNASQAFATVTSQTADALLGHAMTVGDWDADGMGDLVIGEPSRLQGEGDVWVLYGPVMGALVVQDSAGGAIHGASAGSSVALVGDVTGDGLTDLVVGGVPPIDPIATVDSINLRGEFGIYSGPIFGEVVHPIDAARTYGSTDFGTPGSDVSAAGFSAVGLADMNGDGRPDFAASAPMPAPLPFWSLGTFRHGAVGVFRGRSSNELVRPPTHRLGTTRGGIGQRLASAGDVNGDGRTDLLVSTTSHDSCETSGGSASLILGESHLSDSMAVDWSRVSTRGGEGVGLALTAGDTNADGFSDIAISAPGTGVTRLYYGAPDAPPLPEPDFEPFSSCLVQPSGATLESATLVVGTIVDPTTLSADELRPEECPGEPILLAAVENEDGLIWGWYGSRPLASADRVVGSALSIGLVPRYTIGVACGRGWSTAVADDQGLIFADMRGASTFDWDSNPLSDHAQVDSYCMPLGFSESTYVVSQISVDHQVISSSRGTWIDMPGAPAYVSGQVVMDGGNHPCGWMEFMFVRG